MLVILSPPLHITINQKSCAWRGLGARIPLTQTLATLSPLVVPLHTNGPQHSREGPQSRQTCREAGVELESAVEQEAVAVGYQQHSVGQVRFW